VDNILALYSGEPGLRFRPEDRYPDVFNASSQLLQTRCRDKTAIKPRPFSTKLIPIHN